MFSQFWRRLVGDHDAMKSAAITEPVGNVVDAAPAAPEAAAAPAPAPRHVADEASIRRSLDWRSRVLLDGAPAEALKSDGPTLVGEITHADQSVIRQPPLAAQQALRIASDPNSKLEQVTELFEADPMLAQALLRQANSVFYRREGQPLTSLSSSVVRIGSTGVRSVLMGSLVQQLLCRPGSAYDAMVQKVWSHMQRTAPIARAIAPAFRVDAEDAFSLALLHDVGKLVMFDHLSTLRHDRHRELRMPDLFFRQMLWHLHEPLGALAVLRWDMGGEAAHAVGEHHRRPIPQQIDTVTECLFVAECIELAQTNFTQLDWDEVWKSGGITTEMGAVQDRMRRLED